MRRRRRRRRRSRAARHLFTLAALASLALGATAAFRWQNRAQVNWRHGMKSGFLFDFPVGPREPFDMDRLLASQRSASPQHKGLWREVTYYLGSQDGTLTMRPFRRVTVYAWPLTLASIPLPVAWVAWQVHERRRARRRRAGLCVRCGYDLRASPGRCSECGTVVDDFGTAVPGVAPQA